MKQLCLWLALLLGLAACSTERYYRRYQRQHPDAVAQTQARQDGAARLPAALAPEPVHPAYQALANYKAGGRPSLVARILRRGSDASASLPPASKERGLGGEVPRKCKGCTIVYGNATLAGKKAQVAAGDHATASVVEKKAGPAQVASDSAALNSLAGAGNLATTKGNNNAPTQTKQDTTKQAAGVGATIAQAFAGPLGWVVAAAAVGGLGYLFLLWRRRRAATA